MRGRLHKLQGRRSSGARVDVRSFRMINRGELTAVGKTSFELVANFLRRRRVGCAAAQEKRDCKGQQGFHLEML